MTKQTKYIAFCSSKGGVGKSSMTILTASYLHYVRGLKVAVMDLDYPIKSVMRVRDRETKFIENSRLHQQMMINQFQATGQKIYPVLASSPAESFSDLQDFLRTDQRHFDIIIFDMPGSTNNPGVLNTLASLDHVFIPISCDALVMESTLLLMAILTEHIVGQDDHHLKSAHMFWTRVDKREKSIYYEKYDSIIDQLGQSRMTTQIPDRKRFSKELDFNQSVPYRSTLFPPERRFARESNLIEFVDELLTIIGLE